MSSLNTVIARPPSTVEAQLIAGLLEANGIEARVSTDDAGGLEPQWQLTTVRLRAGESLSGFVSAKTDRDVTLQVAGGTTRVIASSDIETTTNERVSLMPEGLLQGLTAQEAADLLEHLSSLK